MSLYLKAGGKNTGKTSSIFEFYFLCYICAEFICCIVHLSYYIPSAYRDVNLTVRSFINNISVKFLIAACLLFGA